ncbi:19557_t:CDS:2 [Cetraspora pellucida]|uniref:Vacuolar calcium ion transporter n=1 Tax=Cetraspora pellucida TaxID=1433469 RepID=A0A9N9GLS5_9GLOM|nr:19557_t:CDS:2 [Cetraspora pellucida]
MPTTHGPIHIGPIYKPTIAQSLKTVLFSSKLNVLLTFIPLGFLAHHFRWMSAIIFVFNFLALIPLANLLGFVTEDIANRSGQTIGGLLNATFGNAVELIISVVALIQGEIRVVQASMLGSIISNLLLVLGTCFLAGGYLYKEQNFNQKAAQTSSGLMAIACIGLVIPAAFHFEGNQESSVNGNDFLLHNQVMNLSHGTALVLLAIYVLFLIFQLKTHSHLYDGEESEDPQLSFGTSLFLLASITVIVTFSADYLIDSIEGITNTLMLSKTFVGLILLPIVGNAAEHATAVKVAMKDKMDLAIGVAVGSSMQIALFVTPFLVILGWIIGQPMSLLFQTFETVVLFVSVLITNYLIQDGNSNWLKGMILLATYSIISLAYFFYSDDDSVEKVVSVISSIF